MSLVVVSPSVSEAGGRRIRAVADVRAQVSMRDAARAASRRTAVRAGVPFQSVPGNLAVPASERARPSDESSPAPAPESDPPTLVSSFAAMGDDDTRIPPDTNGAVGPDHLVVALNSGVRVQDRAGGILSTVSLGGFWSSTGTTSVFDPKVRYDPYGARWIFTAMSDARSAVSSVLLGVSETTDPSGTWFLYRVDADAANMVWADYPSIGFNKKWIVVQANMYNVAAPGAFNRSHIYAFDKSDLYAHGIGDYTMFYDTSIGATQAPALTLDPTLETEYLLSDWNGSAGALRMFTITGAVGDETFTIGSFATSAEAWGESPAGGADFALQSGSASKIQNNDARMHDVVYRDGSLWAAHTVFLPAGGAPTRSAIQWWQISAEGSVVQRARIDDPAGPTFFAFPSIAVNAENDVLVGYSRFSASQFASANYSFRYGADPPGTMRADTVLKAGEASYFKTFSGTRNRWGDYSATVVDPVNDTDLWTIQEYAASPVSGSDRWGTWWGKIVPMSAPGFSVSPSSLAFGSVLVGRTAGPTTITMSNTGTASLALGAASVGGANAGDFILSADACGVTTLAAGSSCTLRISFSPPEPGARAASLSISSNATGSPHVLALSGTGFFDTTAPVSAFTTPANAVVLAGVGNVAGTVTDDASGVASLAVSFVPLVGTPSVGSGGLVCHAVRTSCSWTATVPLIPGLYAVTVRGTDASGNAESPGPTRTIIVV